MTLQAVVVEDHQLIARAMTETLNRKPEIEVVACFNNASGLQEFVVRERPDVVMLDLDMPDMSGFEFIRDNAPCSFDPAVIVCTGFQHPLFVHFCLQNQVYAYVTKDAGLDSLAALVRDVASPRPQTRSSDRFPIDQARCDRDLPLLTARELDIVVRIYRGESFKDIAQEQGVTIPAIQYLWDNACKKCGVTSTQEMIRFMHELSELG